MTTGSLGQAFRVRSVLRSVQNQTTAPRFIALSVTAKVTKDKYGSRNVCIVCKLNNLVVFLDYNKMQSTVMSKTTSTLLMLFVNGTASAFIPNMSTDTI